MKITAEVVLSFIQTVFVFGGIVWTYFRFFREGTHNPRVEFSVDCKFLGPQNGRYVAAFEISAKNCGHIEQKFREIRIRVRGIQQDANLGIWRKRAPLLEFPEEEFETFNIIPPRFEYFFVRPGVEQKFSFVTSVPDSWNFVLARATFKYEGSDEIHSAESAFSVAHEAPRRSETRSEV